MLQQQQNKITQACTTSSQSNTIIIVLDCFHDTLRDKWCRDKTTFRQQRLQIQIICNRTHISVHLSACNNTAWKTLLVCNVILSLTQKTMLSTTRTIADNKPHLLLQTFIFANYFQRLRNPIVKLHLHVGKKYNTFCWQKKLVAKIKQYVWNIISKFFDPLSGSVQPWIPSEHSQTLV